MFVQRASLGGSLLAVAAGLTWTGCNRAAHTYDATVQGAVTIDDELAPRGTVTFHPAKGGSPSSGPIHKDGSYSIRTGQGDLSNPDGGTIRSGEYVVTVNVTALPSEGEVVAEGGPPSVGARLMADKYASKETSELNAEVKAGPNIIDFKLDGPWANPPQEPAKEGAEAESDAEAGANEEAPAANEAEPDSAAGEDDPSADETPASPRDETTPPATEEPAAAEGQP